MKKNLIWSIVFLTVTVFTGHVFAKTPKGFMSAEDQAPLPVTTITFTTASDGSKISSHQISSKSGEQKPADAVLNMFNQAGGYCGLNLGAS